jgi:hypothetical protein
VGKRESDHTGLQRVDAFLYLRFPKVLADNSSSYTHGFHFENMFVKWQDLPRRIEYSPIALK